MDHRPELKDAINLLADLTEAYTAALFLRERGGENLRAAVWQQNDCAQSGCGGHGSGPSATQRMP